MRIKTSLISILGAIILYFILVELFSWISSEIFYDFDKIPNLLIKGQYFKCILVLIIVLITYFFAGFFATCTDDGKYSTYVICFILVALIGLDIYDYCTTEDIIINISMGIAVLLHSWQDILKIIALLLTIDHRK